jgi:apolipoprotein D and lipocalin family protein
MRGPDRYPGGISGSDLTRRIIHAHLTRSAENEINLLQGIEMKKLITAVAFIFYGCLGVPESVTPVKGFEIEKYLGKWYEIARLDHSFERGLECVTAEYSLRENGGVSVVNRGFSAEEDRWREAHGKAYFVNSPDEGYLKVSFFGPFYGAYVVFEIDRPHYRYAFVTGPNKSYLWLLSRTKTISSDVLTAFIEKAEKLGYATDTLVYVNQTASCDP